MRQLCLSVREHVTHCASVSSQEAGDALFIKILQALGDKGWSDNKSPAVQNLGQMLLVPDGDQRYRCSDFWDPCDPLLAEIPLPDVVRPVPEA